MVCLRICPKLSSILLPFGIFSPGYCTPYFCITLLLLYYCITLLLYYFITLVLYTVVPSYTVHLHYCRN